MEIRPREIVLALMFRDREAANELGPPLWTALREVEAFYNADETRADFLSAFLAPNIPATFQETGPLGLDVATIQAEVGDESKWKEARGRYSRTYDHEKLAAWARHLTGPHPRGRRLVVVTDAEISPPAGLRYVLWRMSTEMAPEDTVVSAAPTDPRYWKTRDPRRLATIKHRVRTCGLSTVGTALGIAGCQNPACFLCWPVESVLDLDRMVYLGEEHDKPELALRGFEPYPTNPPRQQAGAARGIDSRMQTFMGMESVRTPAEDSPLDPTSVQPIVSFPREYGGAKS